jgi:hypothetical protein
MPNASKGAELKAAGLCHSCGKRPRRADRIRCELCAAADLARSRRQTDRFQERTGVRHTEPEWKVLEIEAQLKWNKENIHPEVA